MSVGAWWLTQRAEAPQTTPPLPSHRNPAPSTPTKNLTPRTILVSTATPYAAWRLLNKHWDHRCTLLRWAWKPQEQHVQATCFGTEALQALSARLAQQLHGNVQGNHETNLLQGKLHNPTLHDQPGTYCPVQTWLKSLPHGLQLDHWRWTTLKQHLTWHGNLEGALPAITSQQWLAHQGRRCQNLHWKRVIVEHLHPGDRWVDLHINVDIVQSHTASHLEKQRLAHA